MIIWKFRLSLADAQEIEMSEGAKILHVAEQNGAVTLWALVDPDADTVLRRFTVIGTGHRVPRDSTFIGTTLAHGGMLVWHVFEVVEAREPTDNEIYSRHGVEGGIAYDTTADQPGSLGEHDWRL